jgi:small subunit ribosomal protein S6
MMRNYEVLYVLRPDLSEEAVQATREKFNALITNNGGEIVKVDDMGKRRLAYEIKDFKEGIYTVVYFQGTKETVSELDRVIKITEDVIRYLIVKDEK